MSGAKSLLEHIYENEKKFANKVYFTQPYGNDVVKDTTWAEAMQEARKMASYLQSLGFEKGAKIGMISKNCDKFIIAEIAIWMAGYTTVAIFPNTNAETVRYCLEDSESQLLFVGKLDDYHILEPGFPDIPKIAFPLAPEAALDKFDKWDDIIASSTPMEGEPLRDASDLSLFIYTSGSTGKPKGVMHCFGNMAAAVAGIVKANSQYLNNQTRVLSYLPLAHVFERAYIECVSFAIAPHIFFAESLATFKDDLVRAKPTVFISVPRLWVKFQLGVFEKLKGEKKVNKLMSLPVIGGIVKGKILKNLGLNKVKLAASGSAPLPATLLAWYRKLGLNLYEGYAMSEDFAYSHLSKKGYAIPGYVGIPYDGVDVRIDPETREIQIKSIGKMVGYWKLPDKTAESFTDDGYFKTGDRGEQKMVNGKPMLKITGRTKEIFKTAKGEYVSPAPIENLINSNSLIELSLVSGPQMPQPYALVVVNEATRKKFPPSDELKAEIESTLNELRESVNKAVQPHERLEFFVVVQEEWTTENGCLTPTLKIQRTNIEKKVEKNVEGWYESKQKVVWE